VRSRPQAPAIMPGPFETAKQNLVGRWPATLAGLGVAAHHLVDKHGPCPGCGGTDRFRFDDKDGRGTWICSQGGGTPASGDGFDLLIHTGRAANYSGALRLATEFLGGNAASAPAEPVSSGKLLTVGSVKEACQTLSAGLRKEHIYHNADGQRHLIVHRVDLDNGRKNFSQATANGQRPTSIEGFAHVPYNLPAILAAGPDELVVIVEGEKAADALIALDIVATTNAGGAGNWQPALAPYFKGKDVVIMPDNDPAGQKHGEKVVEALRDVAASLRVCNLPGLPEKGDVVDWLAAGRRGYDEVIGEARDAAALGPAPVTTNYRFIGPRGLLDREPSQMLVPGLIPEASLSLIYGQPGQYKSFLALDLALTISRGTQFNGTRLRQGSFVYVAGEGLGGMGKRIAAWHQEKMLDAEDGAFFIVDRAVPVGDESAVELLIDDILKVTGGAPVLGICIDTLARSMGGDENSVESMSQAIRGLDRLKEQFHCAILAVHHEGKAAGNGPRGSSALLGAADTAIQCKHDDGVMSVTVTKQKDYEAGLVMTFAPEIVELTMHGELETSVVLRPYVAEFNAPSQFGLQGMPKRMIPADVWAFALQGSYGRLEKKEELSDLLFLFLDLAHDPQINEVMRISKRDASGRLLPEESTNVVSKTVWASMYLRKHLEPEIMELIENTEFRDHYSATTKCAADRQKPVGMWLDEHKTVNSLILQFHKASAQLVKFGFIGRHGQDTKAAEAHFYKVWDGSSKRE